MPPGTSSLSPRAITANLADRRSLQLCIMKVCNCWFRLAIAFHAAVFASTIRSPLCIRRLELRGGSTSVQPHILKHSTSVVELHPDEHKPELHKSHSVLVLNENRSSKPTCFKIDGKVVTEDEYNERVKSVVERHLDAWIAESDMGGLKAGDVLVPDHCASIPQAIANVKPGGTVYIRKGTYKWDGVLVVQKHMHVRGEPNPDEGTPGGRGRPTLEGRWLLGEKSSGSFKHVNCIARFDNKT